MDIPSAQKITNPNFINYLTRNILYHWNYKGEAQFPCPQPVSIERKDFDKLKTYEYFVGVKNDGVRYIMFFTTDKTNRKLCILCDRSLNFYTVDIVGDDSIYNGTLFDGELVRNGDNYSYIIYDSVYMCGNRVNKNNFASRLAEIDCCVKTLIDPIKTNVVSIETKTFYKLTDFVNFLDDYENHKNKDGIIFMPNNLPVLNGTQFSMFKWKPSDKHTVDFLIKEETNKDLSAYVYHQQKITKFANIKYSSESGKDFVDKYHQLDNKKNDCILECLFVKENQNFSPILVRTDKNYPNSLRTIERTLFNAEENIQLSEFTNI
jgi:mRNA guanylyltransferase